MLEKLMRPISLFYCTIFLAVYVLVLSSIAPAETVIKKEILSFEKCLGVIDTVEKQLAVNPEITVDTANVHKAEFDMSDGKLVIACDRSKNEVRISSK